jgi:hypothetical protein
MKVICFILALNFAGCASAPKYNCDEACALQNMVCVGQTIGTSSGSAFTPDWSGSTPGIRTNSAASSQTYSCAKDEMKMSEIQATRNEIARRESEKVLTDKCGGAFEELNLDIRQACEKKRASKEKRP